jgi:hypothetical protein
VVVANDRRSRAVASRRPEVLNAVAIDRNMWSRNQPVRAFRTASGQVETATEPRVVSLPPIVCLPMTRAGRTGSPREIEKTMRFVRADTVIPCSFKGRMPCRTLTPVPPRRRPSGSRAIWGRGLTLGAKRYAAPATGPSAFYLIVSPRRWEATMSSPDQIERNRGTKDSRQQLAVLREKWPLAFPALDQDVRPLTIGAAREIAAAMGWSLPYTLGVLVGWKMARSYCEAVLRFDQRVALDGSLAETIDAEARELATQQLARLAAT